MNCNVCGTYNDDSAQFCASCGANLNQQNNQPVYHTTNPNTGYNPNPNYGAPAYSGYNAPKPSEPGKGLAIAAMVCGIISFLCFPYILGVLAVIFGGVAKSKGCRSGMATAGIVCGVIGVALWLVMIMFMDNIMYELMYEMFDF